MVNLTISLSPQLQQALRNCRDPRGLGRALALAMDEQNELTVNRIRQKLSGEVLQSRTGRLRNSISRTDATVLNDQVISRVGSNARTGGDPVAYAAIHEFGGQTAPHLIIPKHKMALAFSIGGNLICRKSVHHPGSKIPARPYLRPTLAERQPNYAAAFTKATAKFLGGQQ